MDHAELCFGAYDIKAPESYIKKAIPDVYIVICIEATKPTIHLGLVN
jgi:hypothetical protein